MIFEREVYEAGTLAFLRNLKSRRIVESKISIKSNCWNFEIDFVYDELKFFKNLCYNSRKRSKTREKEVVVEPI